MTKTISIRINETEEIKLQEIKKFYWEKTDINLNTSEFIRFLINKEWSDIKKFLTSNKSDSS